MKRGTGTSRIGAHANRGLASGFSLSQKSAMVTAGALGCGARFALVAAKDTYHFGMGFRPGVGQQDGQVHAAGRQPVQHIAQVGPDVRIMSRGAGHHRLEHRRAGPATTESITPLRA